MLRVKVDVETDPTMLEFTSPEDVIVKVAGVINEKNESFTAPVIHDKV